jgi:hypothetical protein
MPFKPNYRMQRADRDRAKQQKQQKKLERRAEDAALRKARQDGDPALAADGTDQATATEITDKTGEES